MLDHFNRFLITRRLTPDVDNYISRVSLQGGQYTNRATHLGHLIAYLDAWLAVDLVQLNDDVHRLADTLLALPALADFRLLRDRSSPLQIPLQRFRIRVLLEVIGEEGPYAHRAADTLLAAGSRELNAFIGREAV